MNKNLYAVPLDESLFEVKYKRKNANFSIGEDVLHDFDIYTKELGLKKSTVIEKLIIGYLINAGVRKK